MTNELREVALASKAWPYEEARKLLARYSEGAPAKPVLSDAAGGVEGGHVLFETGYGPSGLPHIGTFNEVLRTTMVRHAFETLSGVPTRLIAFSDDMDGQSDEGGHCSGARRNRADAGLGDVQGPLGDRVEPAGIRNGQAGIGWGYVHILAYDSASHRRLSRLKALMCRFKRSRNK